MLEEDAVVNFVLFKHLDCVEDVLEIEDCTVYVQVVKGIQGLLLLLLFLLALLTFIFVVLFGWLLLLLRRNAFLNVLLELLT